MSVDLLLENIEKTQGSLRILKIQKRIATDINTLVSGKNQTRERFYTINSVNLAFRLRKNSICMGTSIQKLINGDPDREHILI